MDTNASMKNGDQKQFDDRINFCENTSASSDAKPDVIAIMESIRNKIRASAGNSQENEFPLKLKSSEFSPGEEIKAKAGFLSHSEDLLYLNRNYVIPQNPPVDTIITHRSGIIGKVIVAFKRRTLNFIWKLFSGYFRQEQEFKVHQVRLFNDVSKYVDLRDSAIFWELIKKIDYDVTKVSERIDRIQDDQNAELRKIHNQFIEAHNKDLAKLKEDVFVHDATIRTLESVTKGLEGIVANIKRTVDEPKREMRKEDGNKERNIEYTDIPDYSYLMLENRFRSSEDEVRERQKFYPSRFHPLCVSDDTMLPVLEIGCGRGEMQELFREHNINAYGIDSDKAMVERCQEKGLNVLYGDGIHHLSELADNSLSGVIALQVVEHLDRKALQALFHYAARKTARGGKIIFETINPRSLLALSSNYFRDPTHVFPMHPDTLSYLVSLSGLKVLEVKYLSKVPNEALLQEIQFSETISPKLTYTVELVNRSICQLNDLLYGYQDYCIIAEKV
jgi:2-polyprenyl-3-methyl-5-hydroxy-6-metoxy-1,4-benzoquinol methylase